MPHNAVKQITPRPPSTEQAHAYPSSASTVSFPYCGQLTQHSSWGVRTKVNDGLGFRDQHRMYRLSHQPSTGRAAAPSACRRRLPRWPSARPRGCSVGWLHRSARKWSLASSRLRKDRELHHRLAMEVAADPFTVVFDGHMPSIGTGVFMALWIVRRAQSPGRLPA